MMIDEGGMMNPENTTGGLCFHSSFITHHSSFAL
jgi:hypothetical protein